MRIRVVVMAMGVVVSGSIRRRPQVPVPCLSQLRPPKSAMKVVSRPTCACMTEFESLHVTNRARQASKADESDASRQRACAASVRGHRWPARALQADYRRCIGWRTCVWPIAGKNVNRTCLHRPWQWSLLFVVGIEAIGKLGLAQRPRCRPDRKASATLHGRTDPA